MKAVILILLMTIVAAGQHRNTTLTRRYRRRAAGHGDAFAQRIQPSRRTRIAQGQRRLMARLFLLCCRARFSSFALKIKRSSVP